MHLLHASRGEPHDSGVGPTGPPQTQEGGRKPLGWVSPPNSAPNQTPAHPWHLALAVAAARCPTTPRVHPEA